eukprot:251999_1
MASHSNDVDEAYMQYIDEFGYPPAKPNYLVAFAKNKCISVSYKSAKYVINHPPNIHRTTNVNKSSNTSTAAESIILSMSNTELYGAQQILLLDDINDPIDNHKKKASPRAHNSNNVNDLSSQFKSTQPDDKNCHNYKNDSFSQCQSANRIKLILDSYNKIVSVKKNKTEYQLQNEINQLLNNILFDRKYSNVELLNDFYHIKYAHHTN